MFALALQTEAGPAIVPGIAGAEPKLTANVWADELPHALFAVTVTLPPPVPAVAFILLVVELPLQVLGSVQVYDVAPLTDATENVSTPPVHASPAWAIVPGVAGAPETTVTASV